MFGIDHQVRVFIFQVLNQGVQYLLLRHKPAQEWPFAPVIGNVLPEEHLQDAIVRHVKSETGIYKPMHIIGLEPSKELFGDVGVVEWPFAYQAGSPDQPIQAVRPGPTVGEFAWMNFGQAFECMERGSDRDCLVRLQVTLGS